MLDEYQYQHCSTNITFEAHWHPWKISPTFSLATSWNNISCCPTCDLSTLFRPAKGQLQIPRKGGKKPKTGLCVHSTTLQNKEKNPHNTFRIFISGGFFNFLRIINKLSPGEQEKKTKHNSETFPSNFVPYKHEQSYIFHSHVCTKPF